MAIRRAIVAFVATALIPVAAMRAAPITYTETGSGLPSSAPLPNFTFDVGQNTITGSVATGNGEVTPDFDAFAFTVPTGMQVASALFQIGDSFGNFDRADWRIGRGSALAQQGTLVENLQANSPGTYALQNVPLTANVYNVYQTGGEPANGLTSAFYTWTFNVVPEPASLSLLGLGFVALLTRRRRRGDADRLV